MLLEGWLFSADGAVIARNERWDPSRSHLRRLPGHIECVGMPAGRQALFCFCERILSTRILSLARSPDDMHVGNAAQVHI